MKGQSVDRNTDSQGTSRASWSFVTISFRAVQRHASFQHFLIAPIVSTPARPKAVRKALLPLSRRRSENERQYSCRTRKVPHPRQLEARRLGASVETIRPGHRTVVEARAREYCKKSRALLAPFGMSIPGCIEVIAQAARQVDCKPSEVWCVAGSGTLATALRRAWPDAEHHVVQVGHKLTRADVAGANIHKYPEPYKRALPATATPFPSDPHYDAKAWEICLAKCASNKTIVFWNVMGPARQIGFSSRLSVCQKDQENAAKLGYWAFAADPSLYKIFDAITNLPIDWWRTDGKPIEPGNHAIIWTV